MRYKDRAGTRINIVMFAHGATITLGSIKDDALPYLESFSQGSVLSFSCGLPQEASLYPFPSSLSSLLFFFSLLMAG
jgi:hypothetical protein